MEWAWVGVSMAALGAALLWVGMAAGAWGLGLGAALAASACLLHWWDAD